MRLNSSLLIPLFVSALLALKFNTPTYGQGASSDHTPYLISRTSEDPATLIHQANKVLKTPITTLLYRKGSSPSGNPHDYFSFARYWWPDPSSSNGLPYIQHDGHVNQHQVDQGDGQRLGHMISSVETLSLAWYSTHNPEYSNQAGNWLRAWFVNPSTSMTPNLEYSQIHLGRNKNHGNNAGVLDGRGLSKLVDALRILKDSNALTQEEDKVITTWFKSYYTWLMHSKLGKGEHAATNNHGSWFLVQAISIARYIGDDAGALNLALEDKKRIENQIEPDGRQPLELRRTDGLSYSIFNLQAQLYVAQLSLPLGVDLWHYTSPRGGSLTKAIEFLKPYNDDPSKWKTNQLKGMHQGFLDDIVKQAAAFDKKQPT